MNKMNDLFGRNLDPDSTLDSAQPLLDEYSLIVKVVVETYPRCKGQGDKFMGMASPLLTRKGGSKLAVSSACAYTAVQLGEIEGRYQLMLQGWEDKEVTLKQIVEWQSFRSTAEQVSSISISPSPPFFLFSLSILPSFFALSLPLPLSPSPLYLSLSPSPSYLHVDSLLLNNAHSVN